MIEQALAQGAGTPLPIRRTGLLAVYGVVPVAGLLWLADVLSGSDQIRQWFPASPAAWPWYGLVFGMPHICASLVGLIDAKVIRHHRRELAISLVVAAASAALMMFVLPPPWGMRVLIVWTMFHVMGQQTGLALAMAGAGLVGTAVGSAWRWLLAGAASAFALAIGGEAMRDSLVTDPMRWVQVSGVLMLVSLPLAVLLHRKATRTPGGDSRMVLATQAMCFMSWLMAAQGYPLLAVLLPRLIHDATAFYFYIQYAGSSAAASNPLLRTLRSARAWHRAGMLPLGIGLALLLATMPPVVALGATVLHYCLERHFWRRGAPMRSGLVFV